MQGARVESLFGELESHILAVWPKTIESNKYKVVPHYLQGTDPMTPSVPKSADGHVSYIKIVHICNLRISSHIL